MTRRTTGEWVVALGFVVISTVGVVTPAGAAVPSAADFAADCNDDGLVFVSGTALYRGGTGVLTRLCGVTMDPGSTLRLDEVQLTSGGSAGLAVGPVGSAPADTTVDVRHSLFDFSLGLDLSPGLSSFSNGGQLVFDRSSARAAGIRLSGSELGEGGGAIVTRSRLVTTLANVDIGASAGEPGGFVHVSGNDIISAGRIGIHAGGGGLPATVLAIRNDLSSTLDTEITAGGSTCVSLFNSPAISCS